MRRLFLTLAFVAAYAAPLHGADARIRRLEALAADKHIDVRFALEHAFDQKDFVEALSSGLPTGFTYHIQLVRHRPNWFDERVDDAVIEVICTYNSVTREYLVNYRRNRRLVNSEVLTDVAALKQRMTSIVEPDLFEVKTKRPYKLRVRVRADVLRGYLLYVVPWDISTRWAETKVRVVKPQKDQR